MKVIQKIYTEKNNFDEFANELLINLDNEKAENILNVLIMLKDNLKVSSVNIKKIIFNLVEENSNGFAKIEERCSR